MHTYTYTCHLRLCALLRKNAHLYRTSAHRPSLIMCLYDVYDMTLCVDMTYRSITYNLYDRK